MALRSAQAKTMVDGTALSIYCPAMSPTVMNRLKRRTLLGMSGLTLWAQNQPVGSLEDEWRKFMDWVSALEPATFPDVSDPAAVFRLYRETLIDRGYSSTAADDAVARIRATTRQSQSFETLYFDKIYRKDEPGFSAGPNAFLV